MSLKKVMEVSEHINELVEYNKETKKILMEMTAGEIEEIKYALDYLINIVNEEY